MVSQFNTLAELDRGKLVIRDILAKISEAVADPAVDDFTDIAEMMTVIVSSLEPVITLSAKIKGAASGVRGFALTSPGFSEDADRLSNSLDLIMKDVAMLEKACHRADFRGLASKLRKQSDLL